MKYIEINQSHFLKTCFDPAVKKKKKSYLENQPVNGAQVELDTREGIKVGK